LCIGFIIQQQQQFIISNDKEGVTQLFIQKKKKGLVGHITRAGYRRGILARRRRRKCWSKDNRPTGSGEGQFGIRLLFSNLQFRR